MCMRKTSVYLEDDQARRLADFANRTRRPQADIIRAAIDSYVPRKPDKNFALRGQFKPLNGDTRSIADIPKEELMRGFGE